MEPSTLAAPGLRADVGAELARIRAARGLSLAEVGRALLLSTRQVRALEQVEPGAFHSAVFHEAALRKYAKYCEVDLDRFRLASPHIPAIVSPPSTSDPSPAYEPALRPMTLKAALAVVSAIGVAAIGVGALLFWPTSPPPVAAAPYMVIAAVEPPTLPMAAVTTAPADESAAVTAAPADQSAAPRGAPVSSAPYGTIQAVQATWMYLHRSDASSTERTVRPGETLALDERPDYLVLGSADVVLTIGGRQIDTAPFIERGQLRMTSRDFQAVEQASRP